jgi:hypothetical protein
MSSLDGQYAAFRIRRALESATTAGEIARLLQWKALLEKGGAHVLDISPKGRLLFKRS